MGTGRKFVTLQYGTRSLYIKTNKDWASQPHFHAMWVWSWYREITQCKLKWPPFLRVFQNDQPCFLHRMLMLLSIINNPWHSDLFTDGEMSYSQTCELRPPKGLGKSGLNSQVVSIARFISMWNSLHGTEIACPLFSGGLFCQVVARTGLTVRHEKRETTDIFFKTEILTPPELVLLL